MDIRKATLIVGAIFVATSSFAQSYYPQVSRAIVLDPLDRPCTQLELGAGIDKQECGSMTRAEVVRIWSGKNSGNAEVEN